MTDNPFDRLRSRLLAAFKDNDADPTNVSRKIGRGPDYIRDFLKGRKRTIGFKELQSIQKELGLPDSAFDMLLTDPMITGSYEDSTIINKGGLISIHVTEEIGGGEFIIKPKALRRVACPWFFETADDACAFIISEETMSPAFESGSIAIAAKHLPPVRGKYTLFLQPEDASGSVGLVRRLLSRSDDEWEVESLNPPNAISLKRESWPRAHPIVARVER